MLNLKSFSLFFLFIIATSLGSLATNFYIDPANGSMSGDGSLNAPWSTLEEVINQNKISTLEYILPYNADNIQLVPKNQNAPVQVGDTLVLMSGLHGVALFANYVNTDHITVIAGENQTPIIKKILLQGAKKFRFENLNVSPEPYGVYLDEPLIYLQTHNWQGPVSQIEVKGCELYCTDQPWTTAEDWVQKASYGIDMEADSILIQNNHLRNVSFGIVMRGNYIRTIGNEVINFSGDGMRLLSSNTLIEGNLIKNCYAVDDNHDDGIQAFTTGGMVVDNDTIRGNMIFNYDDPEQPLLGELQGIGCFDGPFHNWVVENNLVVIDHWHGITLYDATNCVIRNNTVLDPTPNVQPGPSWIKIENEGTNIPNTSCSVYNNVSNDFDIDGTTGSNTILTGYTDYSNNFVDYSTYDFHLLPNSNLIDAADDTHLASVDLEGNSRPQGEHGDIGCYEYVIDDTSLAELTKDFQVKVFPNPFKKILHFEGKTEGLELAVFDMQGKVVVKKTMAAGETTIDIPLTQGVYCLRITKPSGASTILQMICTGEN